MKKTILPALAMLIISAVMLSTASYAWFAMGGTVTAENMNVSVKSDSAYLVILKDTELSANTDAEGKIASGFTQQSVQFNTSATTGNKAIYPVAFDASADGFNSANFELDTTWYTMQGTDSANGTGIQNTKTWIPYDEVTLEDGGTTTDGTVLKDYVLLSTVYIATSKGSQDMKKLKASVSITGDDAINVVIVTSTNYKHFVDPTDGYDTTVLYDTLNNTPIKVDIYVFYNGNDTSITTDQLGLKKIENSSITVSFSADSAQ